VSLAFGWKFLDELEQPFGLRFYHVDADSGLILNGRSFALYGVFRHQEWQALGRAQRISSPSTSAIATTIRFEYGYGLSYSA
jgi:hypothetical protein